MSEDIFDRIYGRHRARTALGSALTTDDRVHVLLLGEPQTAKSSLLACVEDVAGLETRFVSGESITSARLTSILREDPDYLLLDDLDAAPREVVEVLAVPLEAGRAVRETERESFDKSMLTGSSRLSG